MRFIAAPFLGLLETGAWLRNAQNANECATYLEQRLSVIPQLELMFPREVNSVFVKMPEEVIKALRAKNWHFYTFIGVDGVRFVCAWDTTKSRIEQLVRDIKDAIAQLLNQKPC